MTRYPFSLSMMLTALSLLGAGCPCTASDAADDSFCQFLADLTESAFGTQDLRPSPPSNFCPEPIVCEHPHCIRAEDNGNFESPSFTENRLPDKWYGDDADTIPTGCRGQALRMKATTPDGPSISASAQVYQVIDFKALVPPTAQATTRRVRVHAAFQGGNDPSSDRQFGLRVDVYAGDPATFPRRGDPETIARITDTYSWLDSVEATRLHDAFWQPLRAEIMLPGNADFFVVLLEAFEDAQNDSTGNEFAAFIGFDDVHVALDGGNTPPLARPDYLRTVPDTPLNIRVLANDEDHTSGIDLTSVVITRPSAFGTASPNLDGTVTYTPNPGFLGTSTFAYTVADVEGTRSNEATVSVEVVVPVRIRLADLFNTDPQNRWQTRIQRSPGPARIVTTVGHRATGGNPGGFRTMTHQIDGEASVFVRHLYTERHYLPSGQGAIVSLDYREDRISLNGRAVGSRIVVWQNGQPHVAALPTFSQQSWTTEAVQGLRAEDFTPVPDFSASGDTLWFGYERANTNTNPNAVQMTEHGIDNWEVVVFSTSPRATPKKVR